MPDLIYGTAWKGDDTERLVQLALDAGFRSFDTANQRKHYDEARLGSALGSALAAGLQRDEVWLQSKFTFQAGQDHRLPYDPNAPVAEQVEQSLASSLEHLGVDHLDSFLLHGPSQRPGLGPADLEAWSAMEAAHDQGLASELGVSNVLPAQLLELCKAARVAPAFVQNRCYASSAWDEATRVICDERGIRYQGFSLLTANRGVWSSEVVSTIAKSHKITSAQVIYAFARQVGMLPLTGTTDPTHMAQAIASRNVVLSDDEVRHIEEA